VALAEDRNRRADEPDQGNRCYAEPAPRQRDLGYQAEYCYSQAFSGCAVFLAWAARNAAEPAYVSDAAQRAWGSGIAAPENGVGIASDADGGDTAGASDAEASGSEQLDWVSASAWAEAPWDERAEAEAEELALLEAEGSLEAEEDELEDDESEEPAEEATTGPKVPAALPMRRRRTRQRPIRTRGSGEWFYADPLDHEPLVKRRYGVTPPILLGVLGLLVAALIVFMIPTLLAGGDNSNTAAAPSALAGLTPRPATTRAPTVIATPGASVAPSPTPPAKIRNYKVKVGDSLSGIAERFGIKPSQLQCFNRILNKNIVVLGARYKIPPKDYVCTPGWRRGATPEPETETAAE